MRPDLTQKTRGKIHGSKEASLDAILLFEHTVQCLWTINAYSTTRSAETTLYSSTAVVQTSAAYVI
jgi:hypothetical protein